MRIKWGFIFVTPFLNVSRCIRSTPTSIKYNIIQIYSKRAEMKATQTRSYCSERGGEKGGDKNHCFRLTSYYQITDIFFFLNRNQQKKKSSIR